MKICKNCGKEFKRMYRDENGKRIDLRIRKYCLACNPFGERRFWGEKRVNKKNRFQKKERTCKICGKIFCHSAHNLECTTCRNKRIRKERKVKAYEMLGGKCKICGYDKCVDALDLHHMDEKNKKLTFAGSWCLSWETLEKELKKCILVCCRCHREIHAGMA